MVGDDLYVYPPSLPLKQSQADDPTRAGTTILSRLELSGLDTSYVRQLNHSSHAARTAQYVAVNDADKHLVVAMADMGIFTSNSFPSYWNSALAAAKPKWLVVDGNWSEADMRTWMRAGPGKRSAGRVRASVDGEVRPPLCSKAEPEPGSLPFSFGPPRHAQPVRAGGHVHRRQGERLL